VEGCGICDELIVALPQFPPIKFAKSEAAMPKRSEERHAELNAFEEKVRLHAAPVPRNKPRAHSL
jgi:hypothetical protein